MLKFPHESLIFSYSWQILVLISNMSFSPDFKHVVLSYLDELFDQRYIVRKFQMSNCYLNFN